MYLRLMSFLLFCLFVESVIAQAPQGINFQAVARDASGIPMASVPITVRFSVQNGGGTTVYQETHATNTDIYGLFDVVVGTGTPVSGNFGTINWGASQHQVFIEVDAGSGYASMGICQFESVPYALYAENGSVWSENAVGAFYNTGRVGVATSNPLATLHLPDTSNVLVGDSLTGSGFKMLYYGAKGAFRVGYLTLPFGGYNYHKFWDYDSVGYYSFAAGQNSRAKGSGAFAFGSFGWADGSSSVAFFGNAKGNNSYTFGGNSKGRGSFTVEGTSEDEGGIAMYGYTGGRYGVAIGGGTTGLGASSSREDYAVAIGWNADARGQASIALGPSDAFGYNAFSTGWVTEARGNYSSTFGYRTNSFPYASMAIGRYNVINGDSAAWIGTDPVFMVGDGTSNTNRSNSFMIQKNGQTSIGYNAPTGMLQVSSALGSLNNGGTLDVTNSTLLLGTTTAGIAFDANQMEVIGTGLHINFNSPENLYINNGGGSVGIGNSAPVAKLDVLGTGWQFRLQNSDTGGDDWYVGSSSGTWAAGGGKFLISPTGTSTNAAIAITPTKQVGIGITAPSDRLHVYAAAGEDAMRVQINGTTRFRIHDNGGVSIGGNIAPPAAGLVVAGITQPSADNAFTLGSATRRWSSVWSANGLLQTSDIRFKTNIEALPYGLNEIMKLRPVAYNWKNEPTSNPKIGLIAQELREIIPEVVKGEETEESALGVNYSELSPVIIRAIQEQQETIVAQEERIAALETLLMQLSKEVETLKATAKK